LERCHAQPSSPEHPPYRTDPSQNHRGCDSSGTINSTNVRLRCSVPSPEALVQLIVSLTETPVGGTVDDDQLAMIGTSRGNVGSGKVINDMDDSAYRALFHLMACVRADHGETFEKAVRNGTSPKISRRHLQPCRPNPVGLVKKRPFQDVGRRISNRWRMFCRPPC